MREGTIISASAHAAFVAMALIGLPDFREPNEVLPPQVSEVTLVSLSDFQAAQSTAPDAATAPDMSMAAPIEDTATTETPEPEQTPDVTEALQPETPTTETAPDLSALEALSQPNPEIAVEVEAPVGADDAGPIGLDTPLPNAPAQDGSVNSVNTAMLAPERPNLAPRIDTQAAPAPPKPAPAAPEVVPDTRPDETAEPEPIADEAAAAPEEATTEITPDAVEQERPTTPKAAARPKGRPARVAAPVDSKPAVDETQAAQVQTAAAAPEPDPAPSGARLGQDFNSSQKQAIGDVIGGKWNKTLIEGKDNFERLVVIVRVQLNADGKVIGGVEPIDPANPTGDFKVAYDAARRAVLRAQPIPLPRDKFRDGDFLEIRFDPGRAAISLD